MRRRALLAAAGSLGTASTLAGCSTMDDSAASKPTLDRVVARSDTGDPEQLRLTLVHAPPEGSTSRPLWGSYDAAAGEAVTVDSFDLEPGVFSLTAGATRYGNHEVVSFNAAGDAVGDGDVQFEVVVQDTGDVWANINEAGADIALDG